MPIVLGCLALIIGLGVLLSWSDGQDDQSFHKKCLSSGFSSQQCEILGKAHSDSRDAEEASGVAIGMAVSTSIMSGK
jgi:hypothetical protein